MQNEKLTQKLADVAGVANNDNDTKALLLEISEKLGILIDLQRARNPPAQDSATQTEDDGVIDTSWIIPHKLYDNSQFCRIFNVAKITAQKWRSSKLIAYILIGKSVRYQGSDIIRFIEVYAARRNYKIFPIPDE
ncbi:DNA-binding protein [Muribaculaceae bacterium Isolate-001 (NCI)]|nr:DNA-binding protein [Muribaculaceae bacterium Isolate-001 (NCI)]